MLTFEVSYLHFIQSERSDTCYTEEMFARWGICDKKTTDNGPQFSSDEFRKFAEDYGFEHVASIPGFPQSHGEAERAVQIAKKDTQTR